MSARSISVIALVGMLCLASVSAVKVGVESQAKSMAGAHAESKAQSKARAKEFPGFGFGHPAQGEATRGAPNMYQAEGDWDPLEPDCHWELFIHDDFVHTPFSWNNWERFHCGGNSLLGGFDSIPENRPQGDLYTHITALPQHTHIRIRANYYFIDSWDDEYAFLKLDDKPVWTRDCYHCFKKGQNWCGARYADQLGEIVDVIIPHRRTALKVAFGSNLNQNTRDESYAIGNFMVYYFDCDQQPQPTSNRRVEGW